jgi:TonB-dependent SusC/RagA subfamily outer membrane receptor
MKKSLFFIIVTYMSVALCGCTSSKSTTNTHGTSETKTVDDGYGQRMAKDANQSNVMVSPNEERKSNMSLDDMIRRLPGVQVSGSGPGARIKVSGSESFNANTDPLFILNGTPLANYAQVLSVVDPNDITSLTVLKGSDATIYGSRGANGVIVIRTNK